MQYLHKKSSTVYFDENDLKELFERSTRAELKQKVEESGLKPDELLNDPEKIKEILSSIEMLKSKEDIEIFTALYHMLAFYPGTKIGFPLEDLRDVGSNPIQSIDQLKKLTKENDLTDVYLIGADGARAFQLKGYEGLTNSDDLFEFLKMKLLHYALDLGDVNLFVTLRCGGDIADLKLEQVHQKLKELGLKGGGHVLLSYNEENQNDVIVTLYPKLTQTRIVH